MTNSERKFLEQVVPVIFENDLPYCVRLASVPQPWQSELLELMRREAVPIFKHEGSDSLYAWHWTEWLDGRLYCPF